MGCLVSTLIVRKILEGESQAQIAGFVTIQTWDFRLGRQLWILHQSMTGPDMYMEVKLCYRMRDMHRIAMTPATATENVQLLTFGLWRATGQPGWCYQELPVIYAGRASALYGQQVLSPEWRGCHLLKPQQRGHRKECPHKLLQVCPLRSPVSTTIKFPSNYLSSLFLLARSCSTQSSMSAH